MKAISIFIFLATLSAQAEKMDVSVKTAGIFDIYYVCNENNKNELSEPVVIDGTSYCEGGDDRSIINVNSTSYEIVKTSNGQYSIQITVQQFGETKDDTSLTRYRSDRDVYNIQKISRIGGNGKRVIVSLTTIADVQTVLNAWKQNNFIEIYGSETGTSTNIYSQQGTTENSIVYLNN